MAKAGILDARAWDSNHKLALNGEWTYFKSALSDQSTETEFVQFPHSWEVGQGYSTYSLQVLLPKNGSTLAISLPQIYSAYRLSANGQEIANNGKVGMDRESTVPQWRPQTVELPDVGGDSLVLMLTIANFQHSIGGIREPIFIGAAEKMLNQSSQSRLFELIEFGTLMLLGVGFLLMFLIREKKKVIVYFSLFCFSWAVRSMFSNQYVFIHYFPDFNWLAMIRIEYITLYLTMIWAMLFLGRLFIRDVNVIVKYLIVGGNLIFIAITLLAAPALFTRLLNVYLTFAGLILLYGIVVVLIALTNGRPGSLALTTSIVLGVGIFAYDILSYKGFFVFNQTVFSVGYILIFLVNGTALLYFLNILKSKLGQSDRLTYEDFYGKNQ